MEEWGGGGWMEWKGKGGKGGGGGGCYGRERSQGMKGQYKDK